jgi:hypothetical protein
MRTGLVLVAAAVASACSTTSPPPPPHVSVGKDVIAGQNRINRYFHQAVVPKLKPCWSGLQGAGTIDVEFVYKRAGADWVWDRLSIGGSTLPADQASLAQRCMLDSVRGTSFRTEVDDGDATEYLVDWRWPVPWPADIADVARLAGSGVIWGDCGLGKLSKCQDCLADKKTKKLTCQSTCSGYKTCAANQDGNGCTLSQACVSGFGFGNAGGAVIY